MAEEASGGVTAEEREWLRVRGELKRRRYPLAVLAAREYPPTARVVGTPLLAAPGWIPPEPVPIDAVMIDLDPGREPPAGMTGREPVSAGVRPLRADGSRYGGYAAAVAQLDPPALFVDLPTYRLYDADLSLPGARGTLRFGLGRYFDGLDVGEACAHEYAAATRDSAGTSPGRRGDLPLRRAVGLPWELHRRPASMAISTLTVRCDRRSGTATVLLHRRDPAKVGHAGGLLQVVPVGVFQPSAPAEWNIRNDFGLWRSITREYAEELLGTAEEYGSDTRPIDYGRWPFAAELAAARQSGAVRVSVLGLGVDPLTFATDLLTVAVFDAPAFDELFADLVSTNAEGENLARLDAAGPDGTDTRTDTDTDTRAERRAPGIPFTERTVDRLVHHEPMQAAGAALVALAWRHRRHLLG
ncbi:hypothetical protein [Parafrankia discariae]|uniref:hypothetical protein n=1 Tax=Parafrankia discariae TaxID=365528 RepID=UPI00035D7297|nr:hypothetical protein [Parafrankia discariae]